MIKIPYNNKKQREEMIELLEQIKILIKEQQKLLELLHNKNMRR